MKKLLFAFAGFRHGHINAVWNWSNDCPDVQIVSNCEEDADTRQQLISAGRIDITHDDYDKMLQEVECDVVAIGDYYQKHGPMVIKALQAGKHIICDKPLCIKLDELDTIEKLANENGLSVLCQFDFRGAPPFITLRNIIKQGRIGEVHTVSFAGQHPLMMASRPEWYFEPGKQGGTIIDIAIHAIDAVEWITGVKIQEVVAARAWNAAAKSAPHFQDGAQLMLKLENNGGVLGDVSYLAPTKCGYALSQYWDICCHGSEGMARTNYSSDHVTLATHADDQPQQIPLVDKPELIYARSLISEIRGQKDNIPLTTNEVLRATRITLLAQEAADKNHKETAF